MIQTKERPILFSEEMMLALLAGRKTQTRRLIDPQPQGDGKGDDAWFEWCHPRSGCIAAESREELIEKYCPYGRPGDRLWVREPHALVPTTAYRASEGVQQTVNPADPSEAAIYRAGWTRSSPGTSWRPSIHMFRWASRLSLDLAMVRIERLQEITDEEAQAEGVTLPANTTTFYEGIYVDAYARLWDKINAGSGFSWAANPWVWVLTFAPVGRIKLSEAIRRGAALRPQAFDMFYDHETEGSDALGAAFEALTGRRPLGGNTSLVFSLVKPKLFLHFPELWRSAVHPIDQADIHLYTVVMSLGHEHRWSREEIATWVEGQGL